MIVKTFEEAIPIVQEQIWVGKKIGYVAIEGEIHDGHRQIFNESRKYCDFLVGDTRLIARHRDDTEYNFVKYYGLPIPEYHVKTRPIETLYEVESLSDLTISESSRPVPPPNLFPQIMDITKEHYENVRKRYEPDFLSKTKSLNLQIDDAVRCGCFTTLYYVNKYYFKIDVRVTSWKEGFFRFVDKKIHENYLSIKQPLVAPLRDKDNLCISNTFLSKEYSEKLKKFLNGNLLITNVEETKESLEMRLNDINFTVAVFEKYSGDLLSEYETNSTYFHVIIHPRNQFKSDGMYLDSFILN